MKKVSIIFSFLFLFILFFTNIVNASETTFPDIPKPDDLPYQHYIVYTMKSGGSYSKQLIILTSDVNSPISSYITIKDTNFYNIGFFTNSSFNVYKYQLVNDYWSKYDTMLNKESTGATLTYDYPIDYSTLDIYKEDKTTLFFQKTPLVTQQTPTLAETLEVEIPATANKIIQTMKIILLCGVGCLAFLVCLVILPKVLYRFL